jgi:bifunctional DNA primase/polymerase-like protein
VPRQFTGHAPVPHATQGENLAKTGVQGAFDMKIAAVDYASTHGWRVLPTLRKQALLSQWQHRASADLTTILNWPQWDRADGLGVATGGGSGLIVLDVDGPRGETTVDALQRSGRALPRTWSQVTGRDGGGRHLFYRTDRPLRTRSFKSEGLDIRAEGGYVVAAPSAHPSGRRYTSVPDVVASAPDWLEEMAGEAVEANSSTLALPKQVLTALNAPHGQRSEALFRVYRWALAVDMTDMEIAKLIMAHPVGIKVRSKADPLGWLLDDIQRYRLKHVESLGFSSVEHIEVTGAYVATLPSSARKVITCIQNLAVVRRSKEVTVSRGELAILASVSKGTVTNTLARLVERDSLLSLVGVKKTSGTMANSYCLRIPPQVIKGLDGEVKGGHLLTPTSPTTNLVFGGGQKMATLTPDPVDPSHDASRWQALGASWRYLEQLTEPKTRSQIEQELNASPRSARRNLLRLVELGLVVREGYTYRRADNWRDHLDTVAEEHGTAGRKDEEVQRLERERVARRMARTEYARAHGRELKYEQGPLPDNTPHAIRDKPHSAHQPITNQEGSRACQQEAQGHQEACSTGEVADGLAAARVVPVRLPRAARGDRQVHL